MSAGGLLGRVYTAPFVAVAITAQQDLFYIKPAADKICIIEQCRLANVGGTADAGDAQEEDFDIEFLYVPAAVTASSGGTAPTPQPDLINDAAAGFTARVNDTTKATSSGTIVVRDVDGWNVRSPYLWLPAPEHRPVVANAAAFVVRLNTTPADSITVSGSLKIRELP